VRDAADLPFPCIENGATNGSQTGAVSTIRRDASSGCLSGGEPERDDDAGGQRQDAAREHGHA
jgi:hypothetical protein